MKVLKVGGTDAPIPTENVFLSGVKFVDGTYESLHLGLPIEKGPSGLHISAYLQFFFTDSQDGVCIDLPDALLAVNLHGLAVDLESLWSTHDPGYELTCALEDELSPRTTVKIFGDAGSASESVRIQVTIGETYQEMFDVPLETFGGRLVSAREAVHDHAERFNDIYARRG